MSGLAAGSARRPSFGVSELARLLPTLVDPHMSTERRLLCERRSREDLDGQTVCQWTYHISPLFNDPNCKSDRINELSNGVTASDIATIDPRPFPFERHGSTLSAKTTSFEVRTPSKSATVKSPDREIRRTSRYFLQATLVSCTVTASSTRTKGFL
jgi:hypothetical protein